MHSTGKSQIIELKASDALIDFDEYLSEIRTYLPSLNEDDAWIRSGIHIGENIKSTSHPSVSLAARLPRWDGRG